MFCFVSGRRVKWCRTGRDVVLLFLFILIRKDMITDDIVNCFQIFEKFHELLSRDVRRMGARTDLSYALWAEGPSALDQC